MNATRTRTVIFLLLLILGQWLGSVHDVSHVSASDDLACSQCLHGKPKQHAIGTAFLQPAAPPAFAAADSGTDPVAGNSHPYRPRPRGPPRLT